MGAERGRTGPFQSPLSLGSSWSAWTARPDGGIRAAADRYEIWNMSGRKFFFGTATAVLVGAGFGIPFAAVEFTHWKNKTG